MINDLRLRDLPRATDLINSEARLNPGVSGSRSVCYPASWSHVGLLGVQSTSPHCKKTGGTKA